MPVSAAVVERYYSRGWYASLQPVLTAVSNRVPFALFDPLVAVVVTLVATWVQAWRHPGGAWPRVGGALSLTVGIVASLYLVFLATWGLNYRREPVWRHVAFDESRVTRTSIESMASRAVVELNRLHPTAHRASWPDGNPRSYSRRPGQRPAIATARRSASGRGALSTHGHGKRGVDPMRLPASPVREEE